MEQQQGRNSQMLLVMETVVVVVVLSVDDSVDSYIGVLAAGAAVP